MSNFVNLLKNLLSGVFSFFGGLFSSKKPQDAIAGTAPQPRKARNSGYFLELDDAKGVSSSAAAPAQTSVAVAAPNADTAKEAAKSEHAKADAIVPVLQPKSVKPERAAKPAAEKAEPKPAAANAALNLPQPTVTTFAPNYLAPNGSSNGRRRPGANMSSFLDMARQVKTSS